MKNYKSIIFGLSALICFVFIISCEQETVNDVNLLTEDLLEASTNSEVVKAEAYTLPKGFENKSPDEINNYLDNLSDNEREKLIENHRIMTFLKVENLHASVHNQLSEGQLFTDILNEQLTPEQLQRLNNFSLDSNDVLSLRHCYYPQYNCSDPVWCSNQITAADNCAPYNWYCSNVIGSGEHVGKKRCGYPDGEIVMWHLYTCYDYLSRCW